METYLLAMMACTAIIIIGCVLFEKPGWATLSLIVTVGVVNYFSDNAYLELLKAHPSVSLIVTGIYIAAGVIWSFGKWYFYLLSQRDYFQERLEEFPTWDSSSFKIPTAREHKYRILTWMMYWPLSMIFTLIDEPLRRAFLYVFTSLRDSYDRVAAHVFRGVIPDNISDNKKGPRPIKKVGNS